MKAIETLALEKIHNNLAHAYLFIGGSEVDQGKIVDFFSEAGGCLKQDLSLVKPEEAIGKAGEIKISDIRELLHIASLTPNGKSRLAVIYNCEKLNQSSGNILLKSLEEPPAHTTFILFSTNRSILPTIKSRCRNVDLDAAIRRTSEHKEIKELFGEGFYEASQKIDQIIKSDSVSSFIIEIENYLRQKMLLNQNKTYAKALLGFIDDVKKIDSNASPRLILECTYLKMKELE